MSLAARQILALANGLGRHRQAQAGWRVSLAGGTVRGSARDDHECWAPRFRIEWVTAAAGPPAISKERPTPSLSKPTKPTEAGAIRAPLTEQASAALSLANRCRHKKSRAFGSRWRHLIPAISPKDAPALWLRVARMSA